MALCHNSNLSETGNHAYGFAVFGMLLEIIVLIYAIVPPFGTLTFLGTMLCLVGQSMCGPCCCCPLNPGNVKTQFRNGSILNIVGCIVRFKIIVVTAVLLLWCSSDFNSMGSCKATPSCWSYDCEQSETGIFPSSKCFCYPDAETCDKKLNYCSTTSIDDRGDLSSDHCDNYDDGKSGVCSDQYDAADLTYNWCDSAATDAKFGACDVDGTDAYFAFHTLTDCRDDLESSRTIMTAVAGVIAWFVKPFFFFLIAATVCNFGTAIMSQVGNVEADPDGTVSKQAEKKMTL